MSNITSHPPVASDLTTSRSSTAPDDTCYRTIPCETSEQYQKQVLLQVFFSSSFPQSSPEYCFHCYLITAVALPSRAALETYLQLPADLQLSWRLLKEGARKRCCVRLQIRPCARATQAALFLLLLLFFFILQTVQWMRGGCCRASVSKQHL